jgi:uncharacterized cupin superfamily protein
MPPSVLLLDPAPQGGEEYHLPQDKLLSGNPLQRLWPAYTDATGVFFAGQWQSEPGKWSVAYTEEEYCEILEGCSILTDAQGAALTVRKGDRFVIPRGFVGTWEVVDTTRKIYVIHEPLP